METKVHGKNPICLHSNEPLQHDTFKRYCFPKFVCNLEWQNVPIRVENKQLNLNTQPFAKKNT